jgi:hypothetical protein
MPAIKSIKNTRNIDSHNQSDTPLQGSSGPTATVLIRRPYIPGTFDRVLRKSSRALENYIFKKYYSLDLPLAIVRIVNLSHYTTYITEIFNIL